MKNIVYPDKNGRIILPYELNDLCKGCRFLVFPQPSNMPICRLEGLDPKGFFFDCIFQEILPFEENPYALERITSRYNQTWLEGKT